MVDVSGLYVTPGLIDVHVHVFATTGMKDAWAGDNSVLPDGFSFRSGVTTMVDAGSSGWRNFEDFRNRVIDRAQHARLRHVQHRRSRHDDRRSPSRTCTTWTRKRRRRWP